MDQPSTIDLATVAFRGDAAFLELQIASIERLYDLDGVGTFHVVINEAFPQDVFRQVESWLARAPRLAARTRLLSPADLGLDVPQGARGWLTQQSVKIALGRLIGADHYLMLDAKNHFIAPSSNGDFIDPQGRFRAFFSQRPTMQVKWLHDSLATFDLDPDLATARAPPTTTPYLMRTAICRALADELESLSGENLARYFLAKRDAATEFYLYYAFVLKTVGIDQVFTPQNSRAHTTIFRKFPTSRADLDGVMRSLEARAFKVFGLHRGRVDDMEPGDLERIKAVWLDLGLIASIDDGTRILDSIAGFVPASSTV